jgi:signal peptidase I
MEWLLKGQVQVHRAGPAMGLPPGLNRQRLQRCGLHAIDPGGIAMAHPAADAAQERLLIHRLIGTAMLEPLGPIGTEQEQGQTGTICLHRRRQQIGHCRAGGGDHSHGPTAASADAQGMEGSGALIDGGDQGQATTAGQPTSGMGQRTAATARAEHQMAQALGAEPLQQGQCGLQIGDRSRQARMAVLMGSSVTRDRTGQMTTDPSLQKSGRAWRNLLVWVLMALLMRWLVLEPRWIPSGSMLPTLQLQDRILVEKLRPRLAELRHQPLPMGSVVVFAAPPRLVAAGYDPNAALIKRVVGQPGDALEVRDGVLIRNGHVVAEPWLDTPIDYSLAPVRVQDDQLWVLGDNRNASLDSHLWGPLPQDRVIGTAVWRYWPLNRFGPIRFPLPDAGVALQRAAVGSTS